MINYLFLKKFGGHMCFGGATDTPFLTSSDISSSFQSQNGQIYLYLVDV